MKNRPSTVVWNTLPAKPVVILKKRFWSNTSATISVPEPLFNDSGIFSKEIKSFMFNKYTKNISTIEINNKKASREMKLKNKYYGPTPAKWRKLGDALLAVSTTITTYAITDNWSKYIQISALMLGVVGKFLTNFFTEDQVVQNQNP